MDSRRRPNSLRHPHADYSDPGAYFVTLCTKDREPFFGEVIDGDMKCNSSGNVVWEIWKSLPLRYPDISIDTAVVMPDHFHGIIVILEHSTTVWEHENHANHTTVGAIHDHPSTVGAVHAFSAPPDGLCERGETAPT